MNYMVVFFPCFAIFGLQHVKCMAGKKSFLSIFKRSGGEDSDEKSGFLASGYIPLSNSIELHLHGIVGFLDCTTNVEHHLECMVFIPTIVYVLTEIKSKQLLFSKLEIAYSIVTYSNYLIYLSTSDLKKSGTYNIKYTEATLTSNGKFTAAKRHAGQIVELKNSQKMREFADAITTTKVFPRLTLLFKMNLAHLPVPEDLYNNIEIRIRFLNSFHNLPLKSNTNVSLTSRLTHESTEPTTDTESSTSYNPEVILNYLGELDKLTSQINRTPGDISETSYIHGQDMLEKENELEDDFEAFNKHDKDTSPGSVANAENAIEAYLKKSYAASKISLVNSGNRRSHYDVIIHENAPSIPQAAENSAKTASTTRRSLLPMEPNNSVLPNFKSTISKEEVVYAPIDVSYSLVLANNYHGLWSTTLSENTYTGSFFCRIKVIFSVTMPNRNDKSVLVESEFKIRLTVGTDDTLSIISFNPTLKNKASAYFAVFEDPQSDSSSNNNNSTPTPLKKSEKKVLEHAVIHSHSAALHIIRAQNTLLQEELERVRYKN